MKKQALVAAIAAGLVLGSTAPTLAQAPKISGDVIKIGFITDGSSVYADIDGPAGAGPYAWPLPTPAARSTARRSRSCTPTTRTNPTSRRPAPANG